MARRSTMTYEDAVKLLSKDDSAVVNALDQGLGLALLVVTAFRPESALPYFDAKNELITHLGKLTSRLKERMRSSTRLEYEDLLAAAHAVIVMTAFTEELAERLQDLDEEGKWSRELRRWQDIGEKQPKRLRLVNWATQSIIEPPGPTRPSEKVLAQIQTVYQVLGQQALDYLAGLRRWDELNETQRGKIERTILSQGFIERAVGRYREHFLRLAAQAPEFLAWTLLNEHAATRSAIESLSSRDAEIESILVRLDVQLNANSAALGDLPALLAQLNGPKSDEVLSRVADCHRIHQRVLGKPLLSPRLNGNLELIRFPPIREGYVNPNFRLIETARSDEGRLLAQEESWRVQPTRSGLGGFLAAYLRSSRATRSPLLVLGDPGSGKSLLSKILAAQLPPNEFAVARVELRHVRSSQEVSDQIDLELRRQTNNLYQLHDLTDLDGQITRVVIMDGLDELLQLSAHESLGRYLERLVEFQEIEAELGRPVIAVATARTIVMDRVYVPKQSVVIKLEGFSDSQIRSWIDTWNRENARYFEQQQLAALSIETVDRHAELARQPLLLALLALYDAEGNSLYNAGDLDQAELYERIFRRYLERELEKKELPPRRSDQEQLIEQRFRELSTIATGMLNQGRRFITRQEVEMEFAAKDIRRGQEEHVPRADDAVGQFFFLYRAQAQHGETTFFEGYEFIHATFGEFLAARIIAQQLALATEVVNAASAWDRIQAKRHAMALLVPYIAQRPLVGEEQVLLFLETIVGERIEDREKAALAIAGHLPTLMKSGFDGAHSAEQGDLERLATLTLNLVLATLLINRRSIDLAALCADGRDPFHSWRQLLALWKACLAADDWARVLGFLSLTTEGMLICGSDDVSDTERLVPRDTSSHVGRLIAEGRLANDPDLIGASLLWHLAGRNRDTSNDEESRNQLIAFATFRLSPVKTEHALLPDWLVQHLAADSRSTHDLIAQVMGGPAVWSDALLLALSSFLLDQDHLSIATMPALLRLAMELDRRGQFASVRRLLERIRETGTGTPEPADIADLISLLRRYQFRGHPHPSISIEYISGPALPWLALDDLAWIFHYGGFNEGQLRFLALCLKQSPRHQHYPDEVQLLTEWVEDCGQP